MRRSSMPSIPYFEDVFPWMANFDYTGESATQAIYNNEWAPYRSNLGATTALSDLDFYGPAGPRVVYPCAGELAAALLAGPVLLALCPVVHRHELLQLRVSCSCGIPFAHGLEMDVSYTFSHSIDMGSDAERSTEFVQPASVGRHFLQRHPEYLEAATEPGVVGLRHPAAADGGLGLPVAVWQRQGFLAPMPTRSSTRSSVVGSGRVSAASPAGCPSRCLSRAGRPTGRLRAMEWRPGTVKARRHFDSSGNPQFFDNADAINNGLQHRLAGTSALSGRGGRAQQLPRRWHLRHRLGPEKPGPCTEENTLKFDWEVYNVTNTVRFDPGSIDSGLTERQSGYRQPGLLSQPRVMQFALRYDF